MGIHRYFSWLRHNFSDCVQIIGIKDHDFSNIDTFLMDLNGIFHYCCQKVFKYGNFKQISLLRPNKKINFTPQRQLEAYCMIAQYIEKIILFVKPKKYLVLAIDGIAPLSKQRQQRMRRFRSSSEIVEGIFDPCCITPGTNFLDGLGTYLDWYIHKNSKNWGKCQVIFSNQKAPSEGEHKLVRFVRNYGDDNDKYMLFGMDADLIMLALATHKENFYILRENQFNGVQQDDEFFYLNIKGIRDGLLRFLSSNCNLQSPRETINDFILMIFLTGNDFLPHIPTVEILTKNVHKSEGIETLFEIYKTVVQTNGTLTDSNNHIRLEVLRIFLGTLGLEEEGYLTSKKSNFPDVLLEQHKTGNSLDYEGYRKEYYAKKMNCNTEEEIKEACIKYVEGVQWVLTYYTEGTYDTLTGSGSSWKWFYPYNYSPFVSDIAKYMEGVPQVSYNGLSAPNTPFMQLACVLPPRSSDLLPYPLNEVIKNPKFYSQDEKILIDLDGRNNEWEAVIIVPPIDFNKLEKEYKGALKLVDKKIIKKLNVLEKSMVYLPSDNEYTYESIYGNIQNCKMLTESFDL